MLTSIYVITVSPSDSIHYPFPDIAEIATRSDEYDDADAIDKREPMIVRILTYISNHLALIPL